MAKLYVANCTKFVQDFLYRVPESTQIYKTTIGIGRQEQVFKDSPREVLEAIVDQHRIYGIKHVTELDRTKEFVGLVYQFDKPFDVDRILEAVTHNEEALEREGHELRKISAAALSDTLDRTMEGTKNKLDGLEIEIVEEKRNATDDAPKMQETIQVAKPGSKAAARGARQATGR